MIVFMCFVYLDLQSKDRKHVDENEEKILDRS